MGAEYRIDIRDTSGALVAQLTDYSWLSYSKRVNELGLLRFGLPGDHRVLSSLADKYQVEVWRRNVDVGVAWQCDFYGFYRSQLWENQDGLDTFTAECPSQMSLLNWRIVAWYSETANRTSFVSQPAETIAKTLVSYNAGANALASNGRRRDGAISGLTVEADGARGNTLDWSCSYVNLLKTLQDLARVGGGDFDLVKTGAAACDFRWRPGQLGTDRSASVIFALNLGNMAGPSYKFDRTAEKTAAIVGGQGEGSGRAVVIRNGPDLTATNDIEVFDDARNYTTTAGLQADGDRALWLSRARQEFKFTALQIPACYYGLHYVLGDLVTARYKTFQSSAQKIMGVTVGFADGTEQIDLEMMYVGA